MLLTGDGPMAPAVAGTQEWRVDGKDLRGLVTTACGAGGSDLWLLAGGAGPGRQERLILTNPGANPVTTDVTVHGDTGPLGDPVVETVPPGGRVSVLLDARYGEEQHPAVHVRSDGGGVQATLTDTWVNGSNALGAETTAAAAAPATVQVVPGVVVDPTGGSSVRVAVPGDQDAVVRVSVLNREGLVPWTGESVLSVPAGSVGELPLTGLGAGTYAVALRSDVPVVASAFVRIGDGKVPGEIAWSPAASGDRVGRRRGARAGAQRRPRPSAREHRRQQHRRGHHRDRRHAPHPPARPARRPGRHRAPRRRDLGLGAPDHRQRRAARHRHLVQRHRRLADALVDAPRGERHHLRGQPSLPASLTPRSSLQPSWSSPGSISCGGTPSSAATCSVTTSRTMSARSRSSCALASTGRR